MEVKERQFTKGQCLWTMRRISDSSITLQAAQEVGEIHLVDYFSVVTMHLGSKSYAAGQPFNFPFKWRRIGEEKWATELSLREGCQI